MSNQADLALRRLTAKIIPILTPPVANDEQLVVLLEAAAKEVDEELRAAKGRLEVCFC